MYCYPPPLKNIINLLIRLINSFYKFEQLKLDVCCNFALFFFFGDTLMSKDIPYGATSGFILSTDQSVTSLFNL